VRRALLAASVFALLVVAGAALYLWRSLDGIVARSVEGIGSRLLDSEVEVSSAHVDLRHGSASLRGLTVANPRGEGLSFSKQPAFRLDEIRVALVPASLASGPIVLREVAVVAPLANLEVTPTEVNLLELKRRLDRSQPAEADEAVAKGEPRRFRIERLRFEKGTLRADASAVGREVREVELPALQLHDLGGSAGATPGELGQRVLGAFLGQVLAQAAKDRVSELVEKELDRVGDRVSGALRSFLGAEKKKSNEEE
jgi:hypothetical protein